MGLASARKLYKAPRDSQFSLVSLEPPTDNDNGNDGNNDLTEVIDESSYMQQPSLKKSKSTNMMVRVGTVGSKGNSVKHLIRRRRNNLQTNNTEASQIDS